MISALRLCPKCGAEIPADAPEEGCPGCLLENALGLQRGESVTVRDSCAAAVAWAKADDGSSAENVEVNAEAAAGHKEKVVPAAEMLGELGDYELLERIGRGGQGVVFRARQKSLNRAVALKVISLGQWASTAHVKRFRREAEAAASLDHPCIVPIYEVGEGDGSCYFSMKLVEGGQLDEVVRRAPISPAGGGINREGGSHGALRARARHCASRHQTRLQLSKMPRDEIYCITSN